MFAGRYTKVDLLVTAALVGTSTLSVKISRIFRRSRQSVLRFIYLGLRLGSAVRDYDPSNHEHLFRYTGFYNPKLDSNFEARKGQQ